ncbi:unnamed protein product, partial [Closterium sp. NIES-54]
VDAVEPVEVAVESGTSGGAEPACEEPGGAGSGGAEPELAEPGGAGSGGAEPECAESGGAEPGVAESGGAEPAGAGSGGPSGALSRRELPSPQELREWFARRWSGAAGAGGTAGSRVVGRGGATGAGAGGAAGVAAVGAGGTGAGGATGASAPVGAGFGATGAAGGTSRAGGPAGVGADATGAVLGLPPSSGPAPSLECPPPVESESQLQLASPLPAPSPYIGPTGGPAERREPESRPASPRVPLPSPPASSLRALADPESDSLRAASSTVTRFLATAVTDPSFESETASTLVAKLVDFAARCRLDYAAGLVAESASICPPSVRGECALSTDVLEDRQEEFQCFAVALPHLVSTLLAPEGDPDALDIPTPRS